MPNQLPSFDRKKQDKLNKFKKILPKSLEMARKFRSSYLWQKVRIVHLTDNPLCFDPFGDHDDENRVVPATQVHHIKGVAEYYALRIHRNNLASICTTCHDKVEKMERSGKFTQ